MKCTFFFSVSLFFLLLPAFQAQTTEKNDILNLSEALGTDQALTLPLTRSLPLFDTRHAKRILVKLPENQTLSVLAMDRFGLKVRGEGKNGPITGWISQKAAFQNDKRHSVHSLLSIRDNSSSSVSFSKKRSLSG